MAEEGVRIAHRVSGVSGAGVEATLRALKAEIDRARAGPQVEEEHWAPL